MGVIDVLTVYGARKRAAHAAKTVKHGVRVYISYLPDISYGHISISMEVVMHFAYVVFAGWCWDLNREARTICKTFFWFCEQNNRIAIPFTISACTNMEFCTVQLIMHITDCVCFVYHYWHICFVSWRVTMCIYNTVINRVHQCIRVGSLMKLHYFRLPFSLGRK